MFRQFSTVQQLQLSRDINATPTNKALARWKKVSTLSLCICLSQAVKAHPVVNFLACYCAKFGYLTLYPTGKLSIENFAPLLPAPVMP